MKQALQIACTLVVITMLTVTTWAQSQCSLFAIPEDVYKHPWFIATLFDAYFGFLTFYCWVFYKESSLLSRIIWFILIMAGGNAVMSSYLLIQLFRLPAGATFQDLLLKRKVTR